MKGKWPDKGFAGEKLTGFRAKMQGQSLANGWKFLACIGVGLLAVFCLYDPVAIHQIYVDQT